MGSLKLFPGLGTWLIDGLSWTTLHQPLVLAGMVFMASDFYKLLRHGED
jgi:hypothetical protein